jgi:hypothetical protein
MCPLLRHEVGDVFDFEEPLLRILGLDVAPEPEWDRPPLDRSTRHGHFGTAVGGTPLVPAPPTPFSTPCK